MTQTARKKIFDAPNDVERTRDEVRVQLRLASKEIEDQWNELRQKLQSFEQKLEKSTDENLHEMNAALSGLFDDVKTRLEHLRARHGGK